MLNRYNIPTKIQQKINISMFIKNIFAIQKIHIFAFNTN